MRSIDGMLSRIARCTVFFVAAGAVAAPHVPSAQSAPRGEHLRLAVGNHFTVSFQGPEDEELATRALASLDAAFWRVSQSLSFYPLAPIPVVLYTTEEFRDVTRAPAWAAGAYDGAIRVPMRGALARADELDRVLAHEFVHALVRTMAARGVPAWMNEGLAGAFERESVDWAEERVARRGRTMPLDRLLSGFGGFNADDAELAYATSAIAMRRLVESAGGVAVCNLFRDLGEGQPLQAAFEHRMQRSYEEFAGGFGRMN